MSVCIFCQCISVCMYRCACLSVCFCVAVCSEASNSHRGLWSELWVVSITLVTRDLEWARMPSESALVVHSWTVKVHSKHSVGISCALQTFGHILATGRNVLCVFKTFDVHSKWKNMQRHMKCIPAAFLLHSKESYSIRTACETFRSHSKENQNVFLMLVLCFSIFAPTHHTWQAPSWRRIVGLWFGAPPNWASSPYSLLLFCFSHRWVWYILRLLILFLFLASFGHIARMPDETDAKRILTASPAGNWTRTLKRPRSTWMKTIQQDLKSSDLNMDDAVDLAQNRPLWRLMSSVYVRRYALLVVLARNDDDELLLHL